MDKRQRNKLNCAIAKYGEDFFDSYSPEEEEEEEKTEGESLLQIQKKIKQLKKKQK